MGVITSVCLLSSGDAKENHFAAERDEYGADTMTEIHIIGRIVINLWRIMKTEVAAAADIINHFPFIFGT